MQIRDNVRERRREKIARLVERQSAQTRAAGQSAEPVGKETAEPKAQGVSPAPASVREEAYSSPAFELPRSEPKKELARPEASPSDPDPELWWREREKRLKTGRAPGWEGLKGIPPTSAPGGRGSREGTGPGRLLRGIGVRLIIASVVFAGFWGWMKLELPGSSPAREWMVGSVTRDMDFRAIEVWYGDTFGGSPSFLTFGREEPDTREVAALLDPSATSAPIRGTVVQPFSENGKGVRVAAKGDSEVFSVYTGKVQQVTRDDNGGVTVLVQHQNRVLTVYGGLESASVKPNDWVETGQTIGRLGPAANGQSEAVLYFAVQHDGIVIDPSEVVGFD